MVTVDSASNASVFSWERARTVIFALSAAAVSAMALPWIQGRIFARADVTAFFILSLALCFAIAELQSVRAQILSCLNRFAAFLARRGAFSSDAVAEMPKFALLRFAFGMFMLERATYILYYLQPSDWNQPIIWCLAVLNVVAATCVALGFSTQIALAYLMMVQWQVGDSVLGTSTLGNDIAAIFALLLIFANAGAHVSLDRILMKRGGLLGRGIGALYYSNGLPSDNTLQIAKFLSLLGYWCVCTYSLCMHLNEPAWMSGTAGPLLLTNNFASAYSDQFSAFFALGSWAVMLGRIALWAMLPWYALFLPFVLLGGWFKTYVISWAILFYSLSMFVLQLGWLSHFEFLMLAGWFWQSKFMSGANVLNVAYDDRCNLCDRTVAFVKTVDVFGRVKLKPLSKNQDWLLEHGIDPSAAQADLFGVEAAGKRQIEKGYEFYVLLTKHVLLLLPFYPLLVVGRYIGGPAIYRFIADRRTRLFGVCERPSLKADYALLAPGAQATREIGARNPIAPTAMHVTFLALIYLISIPAPFLGWSGKPFPDPIQKLTTTAANAAHFYGIAPINVFNKDDLRLAEKWYVLYAVSPSGERTLLPVLSEEGKRLAIHKSDRLYFGNTLAFRRGSIGKSGCLFDNYRAQLQYLSQVHRGPLDHFEYVQYQQVLPSTERILQGEFVTNPISKVCAVSFGRQQ
ncbi:DCC1-like thiol-disulfide oxidoreductase family protein [Hyphomicrobium sp.]|uniref:DCC1-like thiol-disulfide oxidoreductase family protein n=1 Tax=Hyphomicrobium sp. TaxID=82 RepID=UPI002E31F062|nr:DCC1-like thiol-disulfide oxidoreductase family protein [Hyphomicrobium sp.]HEX2839803.1 DCC1-like thiol-disulfide oxidoreductase family protein [Hyphomicrobium sp.]